MQPGATSSWRATSFGLLWNVKTSRATLQNHDTWVTVSSRRGGQQKKRLVAAFLMIISILEYFAELYFAGFAFRPLYASDSRDL